MEPERPPVGRFSLVAMLREWRRVPVDETLRLYPAGVGIARMARRRTTLAGHRIRRGTIVAIPVYSIQRDPRRWAAPDTFDPDRFSVAGSDGPRDAHLPFGWGPRACLGARFATMEARLLLAMVAARWRVTYPGDRPPTPKITPALRMADGLPVDLEDRPRTPTPQDPAPNGTSESRAIPSGFPNPDQ